MTLLVSLALVLVGVLLLAMAWAGSQGRLRRNGWAGIRVPATMRSDAAWDAAHRESAGAMGLAGAVLICGAIAVAVSGMDNAVGVGAAALAAAGCLVLVGVGTAQGVRAARAVD